LVDLVAQEMKNVKELNEGMKVLQQSGKPRRTKWKEKLKEFGPKLNLFVTNAIPLGKGLVRNKIETRMKYPP
jgi:hypothetical protein